MLSCLFCTGKRIMPIADSPMSSQKISLPTKLLSVGGDIKNCSIPLVICPIFLGHHFEDSRKKSSSFGAVVSHGDMVLTRQ
jgi:hypothetical protein